MKPTTSYRPTHCAHCGNGFYAPTAWVDGQQVTLEDRCSDCGGQMVLGGEE